MKFVLATLALASQAEACWFTDMLFPHHGKHHGHHGKHHGHHHEEIKPLEEIHCDYDKSGDMEHFEFLLQFGKTFWTHLVKGIYQDQITNPIDEKCFGDWNNQKIEGAKKFHHKILQGDFFNMSMAEHQGVANDVVEMVWKNGEYCSTLVPVTDIIGWCGDNDGKCVHKQGLLDRLMDNSFPMAMMLYEMYGILTRDRLCENQTQKLQQIGLFVEDAAKLWSMQEGFDMKFDAKKTLPEESIKEQINKTIQKVADNYPEKKRCPFRPIFELFSDMKHEIKEEISWQVQSTQDSIKDTLDAFDSGFNTLHRQWGEPKKLIPHVPDMTQFTPEMPSFFMPKHHQMSSWATIPTQMPQFPEMQMWGQMPQMPRMPHMPHMPHLW